MQLSEKTEALRFEKTELMLELRWLLMMKMKYIDKWMDEQRLRLSKVAKACAWCICSTLLVPRSFAAGSSTITAWNSRQNSRTSHGWSPRLEFNCLLSGFCCTATSKT